MTVILKNGTSYTESLFTHKGNPSYMFTREEFHQTFREETEKVLLPEEAETIIQTAQNLEKVEDATVLGSLLYHCAKSQHHRQSQKLETRLVEYKFCLSTQTFIPTGLENHTDSSRLRKSTDNEDF